VKFINIIEGFAVHNSSFITHNFYKRLFLNFKIFYDEKTLINELGILFDAADGGVWAGEEARNRISTNT
jgi:hypothetical protein